MIFTVLLAVHILLALLLIGVILLQQGKGATAGAAFGSGASSTVFGARGSASFLTRLTAILAVLFFSNSLLLAYLYGQTTKTTSLLDQVAIPAPGAPGKADVPTKVDVGELVEKATQGKPVDVPAPPPADVPGHARRGRTREQQHGAEHARQRCAGDGHAARERIAVEWQRAIHRQMTAREK
jgi:preprotein translocase subunit SecG